MQLTPIVPVMVIDDLDDALPMANCVAERWYFTIRSNLAHGRCLGGNSFVAQKKYQRQTVGVGTVTNPEELAAAAAAGAQFAISPGITDELLVAAKAGDMPLIPGIATISELMQAKALGYTHFKFFPAEASGGVAMLKSIAGPFPNVRFCPTGGIHQGNYRDYLALNNVLCVGGSWILPADAIQAKDWAAMEKTFQGRGSAGLNATCVDATLI